MCSGCCQFPMSRPLYARDGGGAFYLFISRLRQLLRGKVPRGSSIRRTGGPDGNRDVSISFIALLEPLSTTPYSIAFFFSARKEKLTRRVRFSRWTRDFTYSLTGDRNITLKREYSRYDRYLSAFQTAIR